MTAPTTRVVHRSRDEYDTYIGRPSKWGNPGPGDGHRSIRDVDSRPAATDGGTTRAARQNPRLLLRPATLPRLGGRGDVMIGLDVKGCSDCPFANRSDDGQFDSYCELMPDGEHWQVDLPNSPPPANCPLRTSSRLVQLDLSIDSGERSPSPYGG